MKRKTPLPRSTKRLTRSPVKRVNAARKAREFARTYGSKERVAFVKSLPCAICSVIGYSENAHVHGKSGLGRKGDYITILPLCRPNNVSPSGCHRLYDTGQFMGDTDYWMAKADRTEEAWQSYLRIREVRDA